MLQKRKGSVRYLEYVNFIKDILDLILTNGNITLSSHDHL